MNTDRHGRLLGGERERDGRLLAAAQGIDLTAGSVDNNSPAESSATDLVQKGRQR